jgi:hypothetical protein
MGLEVLETVGSTGVHKGRVYRRRDLTGERYGRLVALEPVEAAATHTKWLWQCDCGKTKVIPDRNVLGGAQTKSCGCIRIETTIAFFTKHGNTADRNNTRAYQSWCSLRSKCGFRVTIGVELSNPDVTCDPRWVDSFEAFLEDMGECPPGFCLCRVNFDEDYTKSNLEWVPEHVWRNRIGRCAHGERDFSEERYNV